MDISKKDINGYLCRMGKKQKLNRIKEVLAEQDKSQVWLADKLNVEFVTVSRYVNNHRQPSIETLYEIAKALKVDPCDLLG